MASNNTLDTPHPLFSPPHDILPLCWHLSTCDTCLASKHPCSWCAVSSTCVPNTLLPYPFAILSPLKSESVCPLSWRERWELRAKPFSCRCSTMTLMAVLVAVLGTLVGVALIWEVVRLGRLGMMRWRGRKEGWWRVGGEGRWKRLWTRKSQARRSGSVDDTGQAVVVEGEREPLLA